MSHDPLLSLLLSEGLPAARADEVLERKVVSGGSTDTALLELGLVDERTALELIGRAWQLPTADRAQLERVSADAIAVFPKRIAERHGLVPVELSGRKLVVAARVPDDVAVFEALLDELGFALSLYVRAVLTTEPRLSWALQRAYALPLPLRHATLLAQWGEDVGVDDGFDIEVEFEGPPDESGWREKSRSTLSEATTAPVFEGLGEDDHSGWTIPAPGTAVLPPSTEASSAPSLTLIVEGTVAPVDEKTARLREHLQKIEAQEQVKDARRRQRVMWTVDDALAELALAQTRDELLEVALRFAWRRLKTAALLVKQGKQLLFWDILDATLKGSDLKRMPLAYDDGDGNNASSHTVARALRLRSPVLGPVAADDPLLRILGRRPRAVLVVPILLGDRVVGAVIGDNGDRAVSPVALAELHMVVPRLGRALGNLILRARRHPATPSTVEATIDVPTAPEPERPPPSILLEEGEEDVVLDEMAVRELGPPQPAPARTSSSLLTMPELAVDAVDADEVAEEEAGAAPPITLPPQLPADVEEEDAEEREFNVDDAAVAIAPSPGAQARESLLLATWRAWLKQAVTTVDDELDELVSALVIDNDAAQSAIQRLVAAGPRALLALARSFPGVLPSHPFEGRADSVDDKPTPFFQVLQRLGGDAVAPILVGELDHDDRLHRWGAVRGLALINVPAALPRLAQRAFDPEQRLASLAVEVLSHKRDNPQYAAVVARLRDLCRRGDDFERLRAVRALAALRDAGALSVLIDLLSTRPRDVADEARTALIEITCQDFGSAERRWRAWLADNGSAPRRRWLLDALAHKDVALRKAAADELRDDGTALFDYRADAPLKEREAALSAIAKSGAAS